MRRKAAGTNGRGVPVVLSHTSVDGEVSCRTVMNWREDEVEDWSVRSSGSSAWDFAINSISRAGACVACN